MTDLSQDDLARFAAVLDEFAASQRQLALGEVKKQRLIVARHVGDMNITFEAVVDEGTSPEEIYNIISPLDGAIDRLKAKAELSDHYVRIANACNAIDAAQQKLQAMRDDARQKNAAANAKRHTPIVLTGAQAANIDGQIASIRDLFAQIDGHKEAIAECRRILDGADPFRVLDEQIAKRLDELRFVRPTAA